MVNLFLQPLFYYHELSVCVCRAIGWLVFFLSVVAVVVIAVVTAIVPFDGNHLCLHSFFTALPLIRT